MTAPDWMKKATDDLEMSKDLLEKERYEYSCFFAQQSIEKALKAYLLHIQGRFPRIHSTMELSKIAEKHDPIFKKMTPQLKDIDILYTITRYPDVKILTEKSVITKLIAQSTIKTAEKVTKTIKQRTKV